MANVYRDMATGGLAFKAGVVAGTTSLSSDELRNEDLLVHQLPTLIPIAPWWSMTFMHGRNVWVPERVWWLG